VVGLPVDACKVVLRGTINDVQDWSIGCWLTTELIAGSWGIADMTAYCVKLDAFAADWWSTIRNKVNPLTAWSTTSLYFYPAGHTVASQMTEVMGGAGSNGGGAVYLPPYVSMVASLRTDVPGRSGRGRNYVPANGFTPNVDAQMDNTSCTELATAHATMLTGWNGIVGTDEGISAQTAVVASFTKSQTNAIKTVQVDSKPDTQHRRTDKLAAAFTAVGTVT
jgi:hypothetical protein